MGTGPAISSFFRPFGSRMDRVGLGHLCTKCFIGTMGESYLKCHLCWHSVRNCKQGWEGIAWHIYCIHGIIGSSSSSFPARHCLLYELLGLTVKVQSDVSSPCQTRGQCHAWVNTIAMGLRVRIEQHPEM